jgi:hypothetical protein
MAATGILLWAHDAVLADLPHALAVLEVTTAVHFYEAILATFSILIWHFYFVIFDPDVYPLKWTVLTGRAPEHEVREEEEEATPQPPEETQPPGGNSGKTPPSTNPSSPDAGAPPQDAIASPPGAKRSKPN